MDSAVGNDEYIQTHSFVGPTVSKETELSPLSFSGDGGSYKLTFTMRIKGA